MAVKTEMYSLFTHLQNPLILIPRHKHCFSSMSTISVSTLFTKTKCFDVVATWYGIRRSGAVGPWEAVRCAVLPGRTLRGGGVGGLAGSQAGSQSLRRDFLDHTTPLDGVWRAFIVSAAPPAILSC
jgi:hypothetical protein